MSYEKQLWVDRQVQNPMTFVSTNNADGTITLTPSPGAITNKGTLLLAERMNHMEDGIVLVNDKIDKELKQITNCDEALETGLYWAPNGTENNPSENNFIIQTFFKDSENIIQIAYLVSGDLNVFYKRYFSTTWSDWVSNVKSVIRVGFNSSNFLQSPQSNLQLNNIFIQNGDGFVLKNGRVEINKDMTALVTGNMWVNTSSRCWFVVRSSGGNEIHMIGQDASGYMTLSCSGLFTLKKGETIFMQYNENTSVYINTGSGTNLASSLNIIEI